MKRIDIKKIMNIQYINFIFVSMSKNKGWYAFRRVSYQNTLYVKYTPSTPILVSFREIHLFDTFICAKSFYVG